MWCIDNWIQIHEKVNKLMNMMDVSFSLVDNWSQIHSWKSLWIHEYDTCHFIWIL